MKSRLWHRVAISLVGLGMSAFSIARADWSVTNGPYAVRQTGQDITVSSRSGSRLYSARAFADAQYRLLLAEFKLPSGTAGASSAMFVRHRFRFMSLTGPFLAVRDEADVDVKANAIPAGKTQFWTVDLRKGSTYGFSDDPLTPSAKSPGAFVNLRTLFPDSVIAAAVAGTDLGRLARSKPGSSLRDVMSYLGQVGMTKPNCFLPDVASTWSFALEGERPSSVVVQLGLPGQSYCRTNLTVLHLALPRIALRKPLGPQLLPPADLPEVTVDIGTPRKQ